MLQIDVILLHSQESQAQLREEKDKMRRDNYELRETLERHLHLIEQKDRTIKTLQVLLLIEGIYVVCCVGDFKGRTVYKFMMCANFPDVCTLH